MSLATDADDLVASGTLVDDVAAIGDAVGPGRIGPSGEPARITLRLIVPAAVRRAGRGGMTLEIETGVGQVADATLVWMVTTNKGWAHLRGLAHISDGDAHPFRADLFAASTVPGMDDDRLALRIYAPGTDPNVDGPVQKFQGRLPRGSIRLHA